MAKLTDAQVRALAALPCSITLWGGKPFSGMPYGIRSRSTLQALDRLGLAELHHDGFRERWDITPAGRLALNATPQDGKGGEE